MFERDTDRDWHNLAQADPFYAVLTDPRFRRDKLDDAARADFFASGQQHIDAVLMLIRAHVDPSFQPKRALDFGCGVGRLVAPLARVCEEVVGVDIAAPMLREAAEHCARERLTNVSFARTIDELPGQFDFVHSVIVFQHIPPARGMVLARELLGRLRADGIGALHFTYAIPATRARRLRLWAEHHLPLAHELFNVIGGDRLGEPMMQMNEYDLNALMQLLSGQGVRNTYVHLTDHGGYLGAYLFFKKSTAGPRF